MTFLRPERTLFCRRPLFPLGVLNITGMEIETVRCGGMTEQSDGTVAYQQQIDGQPFHECVHTIKYRKRRGIAIITGDMFGIAY